MRFKIAETHYNQNNNNDDDDDDIDFFYYIQRVKAPRVNLLLVPTTILNYYLH